MSPLELLRFIENPNKKDNCEVLTTFFLEHKIDDDQKKCSPRWQENIGNTLLVETKRKGTSKGIDMPVLGNKANELYWKSESMCICIGSDAEEDTTDNTKSGFPFFAEGVSTCGGCQ